MPLSPPTSREHVHDRRIECTGYRREDGLWDIEGRLVDSKHYGFDSRWRGHVAAGEAVHDLSLRLTVDEHMLIHAAEASMDATPYPVCPAITGAFERLEGLRIGPGFRREVGRLLGGTAGCTHLVELLTPMATTAFQTMAGRRFRELARDPKQRPPFLDTCHAHASDGEVVRVSFPEFYTGPDATPVAADAEAPDPAARPDT